MTARPPRQALSQSARIVLESAIQNRRAIKQHPAQKPDLAQKVVTFFSFDAPEMINFGPSYNQTAKDLYEFALLKGENLMAQSYTAVAQDHSKDEKPAPMAPVKPPEPPEMKPEDSAKLVALRAKASAGKITDGEKSELDKLALMESNAAGHPAPADLKAPVIEPEHMLFSDVLTAMERIAAAVPTAGLGPFLAMMRAKLGDIIDPPKPSDKK